MGTKAKQVVFTVCIGLVSAVLGAVGSRAAEQWVPVSTTLLAPTELKGIDGYTVSVVSAEQKPGAVAGWHYHNGYEIVLLQEGSSELEVKGQAPRTLHAGEVYVIPAGVAHRARNLSTTQPYKLVGFLIMEKGKPARVELPK